MNLDSKILFRETMVIDQTYSDTAKSVTLHCQETKKEQQEEREKNGFKKRQINI
jgi:hypothetical protein